MGLPRFRPPQPRLHLRPAADLLRSATLRASRLTETEIRETMAPIQHCATRLRQGVATELQVETLRTTMAIALSIERLGLVRGMAGHMESAVVALGCVVDRANETGNWCPVVPHLHEIDAITCAVDLHDHQLRQLSAAELSRAVKLVIAQARSQSGSQLLNVTNTDLGMEVPQ